MVHSVFDHLKRHMAPGVIAALVMVSLMSNAAAQDVSEEQLEDFERYVAEASQLIDEGDFREGIDRFDRAREIIDHPRLSVAVADAYLEWNRCSQARDRYRQLLDRDDLGEERRDAVETGLAEATDDCTQMADLQIECSPTETTLRIEEAADGPELDCPFDGDVQTGDIEIKAEAPDHVATVETVHVDADGPNRHNIDLMHVDDDSDLDWAPVATWGTIGVGSALLAGGLVSDYRTGRRIEAAAEARDDGDYERLDELESDADSARTRTAVLYGTGGLLVATGVTLQLIGVDAIFGGDDETDTASLDVGPGSISTTWRW